MFGFWQVDGEGGADADLGGEFELATVFANDGQDGGETEARTVFFCRKKRIEDFFDVLGFDAATVVAHRELDVVAGGE